MTASADKHTEPTKLPRLPKSILIALITIAIISLAVWGIADYLFHNRAADIAAPFERSLVANGAIKECNSGDAGRGLDNVTPHYGAYYDVRMNKDDAISLMYRVAKDNGYNLAPTSQGNQGQLSFADDSKQQPYGDIEMGTIKVEFTVNGPGARGCKNVIPSDHASISFNVYLPEFKH